MSWRTKTLLLAGAGALLAALPALGQDRNAPQSLLPPGFGDNQNLPPPAPKGEQQTRPQQQQSPQQQAAPTPSGNAAEADLSGNVLGDVEEVQLDQSAIRGRPIISTSPPAWPARPTWSGRSRPAISASARMPSARTTAPNMPA